MNLSHKTVGRNYKRQIVSGNTDQAVWLFCAWLLINVCVAEFNLNCFHCNVQVVGRKPLTTGAQWYPPKQILISMANQIGLLHQFATNIFGTSVQTEVCLMWEFTLSKIKIEETNKQIYFPILAVWLAGMRGWELSLFITYTQGTAVPHSLPMENTFQESSLMTENSNRTKPYMYYVIFSYIHIPMIKFTLQIRHNKREW